MSIGFEVGPDLVRRPPGEVVEVPWADVGFGSIVRGKGDRMHTITREEQGWIELKAVKDGQRVVIKKPTEGTIFAYVPSEEEALILLNEELGARLLRDIEEREHSIARALNWKMEPCASTPQALRDHLDMIHNINVDDVFRRAQGGTEKEKKDMSKEGKAARRQRKIDALAELRNLHDEAHTDPSLWPMRFPHTHTLEVQA